MDNGLYRNRKNGRLYRILHRALDCTNARDGTPVVVYRPEEAPGPDPALVFVRDEAEFLTKFDAVDERSDP